MIPSQLKKQLDGVMTKTFILKRSVFQNCLELFPYEEWKSVMDKVNKLNRFVKKNNDFIRMYTAGVRSIDMDSNGRILIPKDLITISKLNIYTNFHTYKCIFTCISVQCLCVSPCSNSGLENFHIYIYMSSILPC